MLLISKTSCFVFTISLQGNYPSSPKKHTSSFSRSFSQVTSHMHFPFLFLAPLLSFNPSHITLAVNYLKQANICNKPPFCQTRASSETDTLKVSLSWLALSLVSLFCHPVPMSYIPSSSPSAPCLTTLQMPALMVGGTPLWICSFPVALNRC